MPTPTETVQDFYAALGTGDIERAMSLMTDDIEWITMLDSSNITGRGPNHVVDEMLKPLAEEWESYALSPSEFIADGKTVVSLGRFTCVHSTTSKRADAQYAHVWTIEAGKVARFRQYIDTLAIAQARQPDSSPSQ